MNIGGHSLDDGDIMDVIIPLGGKGTRMRPLTHSKPKALIEVAGKTVLGHILSPILNLQPNKVIFVLGDKGEMIQKYILDEYPSLNSIFVWQNVPLGQAHAVNLAKKHVKNDVLIVFGDTIIDINFEKILLYNSLIFVKKVDNPRRFGVVEIDNGKVTNIIEKPEHPKSNLVNIGVFYFRNSKLLFDSIDYIMKRRRKIKGEYYISEVINHMINKGETFKTYEANLWLDCGTPNALLETNQILLTQNNVINGTVNNSVINPPVYVGKNVKIEDSVIGPNVSIGNNSTIQSSIIKNSIIDKNASIENLRLIDSVIGESAILKGKKRKLIIGDNSVLDGV